jgi:hypothetical protein
MIPYLLLPGYYKWVGAILVISGFVLNAYTTPDINNLASGLGLLVQVLILLGLLLFAGAKQTVEDELVKHYRLVSMQWAIVVFILARLSFKTFAWYQQIPSSDTDFGVNFLLEVYLLLFYYHQYIKHKLLGWFSPQ